MKNNKKKFKKLITKSLSKKKEKFGKFVKKTFGKKFTKNKSLMVPIDP